MRLNLLINKECNRNCSYCFVEKKDESMTIEQLSNILDNLTDEDNSVNVIGGEPSLHEDFLKILEMLHKKKNISFISVMTNGITKDDNILKAMNVFKQFNVLGLGINFTELDDNLYKMLWFNLSQIEIDDKLPLCLSLILSKNKQEILNQIRYLGVFSGKYDFTIKVSLPHISSDSNMTFDEYMVDADIFVEHLKQIIEWRNLKKPNSEIIIDCGGIYRCMFKNEADFEYVKSNVSRFKSGCKKDSVPFVAEKDIAYSCFPAKFITTEKIDKNLNIIYDTIKNKKMLETNIPNTCKNCAFYANSCYGPCYGFYKNQGV